MTDRRMLSDEVRKLILDYLRDKFPKQTPSVSVALKELKGGELDWSHQVFLPFDPSETNALAALKNVNTALAAAMADAKRKEGIIHEEVKEE